MHAYRTLFDADSPGVVIIIKVAPSLLLTPEEAEVVPLSGSLTVSTMDQMWPIVQAAARPEIKLILLMGVGVGVELTTEGGFGTGRLALADLIRAVFVPSLIFTKLGPSAAATEMSGWWPIPVLIFFNVAVGLALGWVADRWLFNRAARPRGPRNSSAESCAGRTEVEVAAHGVGSDSSAARALFPLAVGVGNYGNLPIVVLSTLCADTSSPLARVVADPTTCEARAITWAVVGMAVGQFTMWSFSLPLLQRARDHEREHGPGADRGLAVATESTTADRCRQAFVNPPILTSVASLCVALVPSVQGGLFGEASVFGVVVEALEVIAGGFIPAVTILLGSSLAATWTKGDQAAVRPAVVGTAVVLRLAVLPAICAAVQTWLFWMGWLGAATTDPLFRIYLLILTTVPAAINLSTVCNLLGFGQSEAATLLFAQYVCAPVPMALFIAFYFYLVLPPE
jgi:hypothetical protein